MPDRLPPSLRQILTEKMVEALGHEPPDATQRQVRGPVALPGKVTSIIGMRRAGKTTFLHQLRRDRLAAGWPLNRLPYLNFEDERLVGLRGEHLGFLLDERRRQVGDVADAGPIAWCFDEIQTIPGWERFVRRLLDTGDAEIFVTGSSAALLSREIATALRGRAWTVLIHPFSFAEALVHRGIPSANAPAATGRQRTRLERAFREWLAHGGFPEAQGLDDPTRRQLLRDYVDVAMLRDVVERHAVSNVAGLRWLVRHLLGNAAAAFSVEKFHAALRSQGLAIARDTVHQLLAHLEDCFLVRLVWMESRSERQRMVNPRKAYPVDPGLIPVFDRSGRANLGHALETAVLVELERRRNEVTYVRTADGHEVDFLARAPDGAAELIQVCADASDPATATRELRALTEALAMHPDARPLLLTADQDGFPAGAPSPVEVRTAWEWMLEGTDRARDP